MKLNCIRETHLRHRVYNALSKLAAREPSTAVKTISTLVQDWICERHAEISNDIQKIARDQVRSLQHRDRRLFERNGSDTIGFILENRGEIAYNNAGDVCPD